MTTLVGALGADPEMKFLPDGTAVARFRVACTPRKQKDGKWEDGETSWFTVNVWRKLAENVVESLSKGDQVIVYGALRVREYETDGVKRTSTEVEAYAVGTGLQFATAKPVKEGKSGGRPAQSSAKDDPWASSAPAQARSSQAAQNPASAW